MELFRRWTARVYCVIASWLRCARLSAFVRIAHSWSDWRPSSRPTRLSCQNFLVTSRSSLYDPSADPKLRRNLWCCGSCAKARSRWSNRRGPFLHRSAFVKILGDPSCFLQTFLRRNTVRPGCPSQLRAYFEIRCILEFGFFEKPVSLLECGPALRLRPWCRRRFSSCCFPCDFIGVGLSNTVLREEALVNFDERCD